MGSCHDKLSNTLLSDLTSVQDHPSSTAKHKKLTHSSTQQVFPHSGIHNIGNTCFANSAIVALWFTPGLPSLLMPSHPQLFQALSELRTQPEQAVRSLLSLFPALNDGHQHCAHSLYSQVVSKLVIQAGGPKVATKDRTDSDLVEDFCASKGREEFGMFGSVWQNKYTCSMCRHVRKAGTCSYSVSLPIPVAFQQTGQDHCQFETGFFDSQLTSNVSDLDYTDLLFAHQSEGRFDLSQSPPRNRPTVLVCYQYFQRVMLMTPENTFECSSCGHETQHYKQTVIIHSPTILVIHFQRYDEETQKKSTVDIQFDEAVDLAGVTSVGGRYRLYAVVHHNGELQGGHYWATVHEQGNWVKYNDSQRTQTALPSGPTAYLLFYSKTD